MSPKRSSLWRWAASGLRTVFLGLSVPGLAAAQNPPITDHVVPTGYQAAEAPGTSFWAFTPFASRQQVLIDGALLSPLRLRPLWAVSARRNMGDPSPQTGGRLQIEVWLSHSPQSASAPADTFAANRGPDHRRVFSGVVTLPAVGAAPTTPAPWSAPWAVTLPFATPFTYTGGTLCLETITVPAPPTQDPPEELPWWPVDAQVQAVGGQVQTRGQSCIPGMLGQPAAADAAGVTPGGTVSVWLRGQRRGFGALCMVGLDDQRFGSLPLPFDLAPIGAPGCTLWNDWVFVLPTTVGALPQATFGFGSVSLRAPLDPGLLGQALFAQWVVPDPGRTPLGVSFSNGVVATFGPGAPLTGFGWLESTVPASSGGRRLLGRAPVLRFLTVRP